VKAICSKLMILIAVAVSGKSNEVDW